MTDIVGEIEVANVYAGLNQMGTSTSMLSLQVQIKSWATVALAICLNDANGRYEATKNDGNMRRHVAPTKHCNLGIQFQKSRTGKGCLQTNGPQLHQQEMKSLKFGFHGGEEI